MDCGKAGFVFSTFAFHMHAVTIAYHGFAIFRGYGGRGNDKHDDDDDRHHSDYEDRDDAIKAFLIIAYLLYLFAFLIQVIQTAGEDLKLSKKIWGIILFIVLLVAGSVRSGTDPIVAIYSPCCSSCPCFSSCWGTLFNTAPSFQMRSG